jgi:hypothetical protein
MKKFLLVIALLLTPSLGKAASLQYIPSTSTYFNYRTNIASASLRNLDVQTGTFSWVHASSGSFNSLTISTLSASVNISSGSANLTNLTSTGAVIGTMTATGMTVIESTFTRAMIGVSTTTNGTINNANLGLVASTSTWTLVGSTFAFNAGVFSGTKVDVSTSSYSGTNLFIGSTSWMGTNTNNNACVGCVGEVISNSVGRASVSFASSTTKTLFQILISSGDWDAQMQGDWAVTSGTPVSTGLAFGISTTSNTIPSVNTIGNPDANGQVRLELYGKALAAGSDDDISGMAYSRISLATPTTYYMVANCSFGAGSIGAGGSLFVRRRR